MAKRKLWHFVSGVGPSDEARVTALCGARVSGQFPLVFDDTELWRRVQGMGMPLCAHCARRVERAGEMLAKLTASGPLVLK